MFASNTFIYDQMPIKSRNTHSLMWFPSFELQLFKDIFCWKASDVKSHTSGKLNMKFHIRRVWMSWNVWGCRGELLVSPKDSDSQQQKFTTKALRLIAVVACCHYNLLKKDGLLQPVGRCDESRQQSVKVKRLPAASRAADSPCLCLRSWSM